jgi:GNAT superfamily N-acetyltransferase
MTHHEARRITLADRSRAAAALASGFADDPVWCWLAGTDDSERRLYGYWRAVMGVATSDGSTVTTYVAGDADSVAVWRPVDRWKVSTGELVRVFPSLLGALRHRLVRSLSLLSAMEEVHPAEPHHYLEFVATHRDRQGQGLGAAVLQPALDQADDEGVGAYLESSNVRNLAFYARFGFTERATIEGKRGGPPVFPMWRDPR